MSIFMPVPLADVWDPGETLRTSTLVALDVINQQQQMLPGYEVKLSSRTGEIVSRKYKLLIYDIFIPLPPHAQVCHLSATMAHETLDLQTNFMRDAVRFLVDKDQLMLEGIHQLYVSFGREQRVLAVR